MREPIDEEAVSGVMALAGALDQSTVIVRQWDGRIDHWTAGCERMYGWSALEAVGAVVQDLLRARYPEPLEEIQHQLLKSGAWKGELEHVRRDGSKVLVSVSSALMNDAANEPPNVIETHTDITYRLQIQRELEAANSRLASMALELERSNQELEQFARIASHDLSAPITSTRWLVDLLISRHADRLDDSGRKILKQISQGLDRMSDLVDAVLAHARMGTSAIGSPEPVPAATAVAIAIENLRKHVELSGAAVHSLSLPAVNIDKHALTQLFQNLLSNAIKYRQPSTPPVIEISAEWKQARWEFAVRDNGIGIEREWHQRIFQPMQRRHGMEIAGSGIGLATCMKIVTRAGGEIWVESEPGQGSTFRFTLPGPAAARC
jgi:PAS domain S-box-containing protein